MKVFISYKHGTDDQNRWVKKLAEDLVEVYGIDCLLDQFELLPGGSIQVYMQRIATEATHVIFVITPAAVAAVEADAGGISFEAQLWSSLRQQGRIKVIPIMREGTKTVAYVAMHLYVDFRDDEKYAEKLKFVADTLLERVHRPTANIRSAEQYTVLSEREKIDFVSSLTNEPILALPILARALQEEAPAVSGAAINRLRSMADPQARSLLEEYEPPGMVMVPAGPFQFGEGDDARFVGLEAFHIDRFPVTNRGFARFCALERRPAPHYWNGPSPSPGMEEHPVVAISWNDASAYAEWVGKRLPTEAEWEKAASWDPVAQRRRRYPWGDDPGADRCNMTDRTTPVGQFSPNGDSAYGVADLYGNSREWTSSFERDYPYDPIAPADAAATSTKRIVRGASWNRLSSWGRIALLARPGPMPTNVYRFRCALTL